MLVRSILAKYCMQEARFNFTSFHHCKNATTSAQYFWLVAMQSNGASTSRGMSEERIDACTAHFDQIRHAGRQFHFH